MTWTSLAGRPATRSSGSRPANTRRLLTHRHREAALDKIPAVPQRDFAAQGGTDIVHDSALDLRLGNVRIEDLAAVDRAHDPMHPYMPRAGNLNFSDLREVGAPAAVEQCDAAAAPARRSFAHPASLAARSSTARARGTFPAGRGGTPPDLASTRRRRTQGPARSGS